jgi:hypothetical protein
MGLYIHPVSRLTLGAWFMPPAVVRVWNGEDWLDVTRHGAYDPPGLAHLAYPPFPDGLPRKPADLRPATQPDAWIAIDNDRLSAIRLDADRNRDEDRLMKAYWWLFEW